MGLRYFAIRLVVKPKGSATSYERVLQREKPLCGNVTGEQKLELFAERL